MESQYAFVNWFRSSTPYIHAHRDKTFVIYFGGEALQDANFEHHVHDFALLTTLGIRLVLVHGLRPQIEQRLARLDVEPVYHKHIRVTDEKALQCVKEAAGMFRVEIEALLSMGLASSPMAGSDLNVSSGNFITAKPIGVIDGVDYCYSGDVRRVDSDAIHNHLDKNSVVIISPVGYSPSGEVFNLSSEQVAKSVATALKAEKLILLTEQSICNPETGKHIQQMTTVEARAFLQQYPDIERTVSVPLNAAIQSCQQGIDRVHLLNRTQNGALLLELFTRDGIGTLISSTDFEELRTASIKDIGGILKLIKPLEQEGVLVTRSREKIEIEIADYIVLERDGLIIACIALHPDREHYCGIVACLAVHPDYRGFERGNRLMESVFQKAKAMNIKQLFVLSTQTMHWFIERGFVASDINNLPSELKLLYNPQRNSKILCKIIE